MAEMVKSPLACNAGDLGSILGSGRSPGGGHGNPFQYSCMENPMDRVCIHTYIHIYIYISAPKMGVNSSKVFALSANCERTNL